MPRKKAAQKHRSKKASKKKPESKALPEMIAVLVCDNIFTDTASQKHSLQGVFTRMQSVDPSKPLRRFSIFVKLFGGVGEFNFGIEIADPKGKVVVQKPDLLTPTFEPDNVAEIVLSVHGVHLREAGRYRIFPVLDGIRLGNGEVIVVSHQKSVET